MGNYHHIDIRAFYDDSGDFKRIRLDFLPDSFRIPIRNSFQRVPIPLTSSQFLLYEHTEVPVIQFRVTIVNGLDTHETSKPVTGVQDSLRNTGDKYNRDYGHEFNRMCRHLYSLSTPLTPGLSRSRPPPRCVLQLGGVFRATGVFETIDIEYRGPWDTDGSPLEADVDFTFHPSQFYDSVNPVGVSFTSEVDAAEIMNAATDRNTKGLERALEHAPSMSNMEPPDLYEPFIIYYGEPEKLAER